MSGYVEMIPCRGLLWYEACPNCRRKIVIGSRRLSAGSGFGLGVDSVPKCDNCGKAYSQSIFVYNFTVKISDHNNSIYAQVLGD